MQTITIENRTKRQVTASVVLPANKQIPQDVQNFLAEAGQQQRPAAEVQDRPNASSVLVVHFGSSLDRGVVGALQPVLQVPRALYDLLRSNKTNNALFGTGGELHATGAIA